MKVESHHPLQKLLAQLLHGIEIVPPKNNVEMQINCICCNRALKTVLYVGENPTVIPAVYDGLIFRSTGNYGSKVFDPMPTQEEEMLQVVICDDCIEYRVKRVVKIHNIKRITTADAEPFEV